MLVWLAWCGKWEELKSDQKIVRNIQKWCLACRKCMEVHDLSSHSKKGGQTFCLVGVHSLWHRTSSAPDCLVSQHQPGQGPPEVAKNMQKPHTAEWPKAVTTTMGHGTQLPTAQ